MILDRNRRRKGGEAIDNKYAEPTATASPVVDWDVKCPHGYELNRLATFTTSGNSDGTGYYSKPQKPNLADYVCISHDKPVGSDRTAPVGTVSEAEVVTVQILDRISFGPEASGKITLDILFHV